MAQAKLLLDTNVVVDYLNEREPFYEKARLLMIGGRVGEFELWISSSQVTDLVYILSNGGRTSEMEVCHGATAGLAHLRQRVCSEREGSRPDACRLVARPRGLPPLRNRPGT